MTETGVDAGTGVDVAPAGPIRVLIAGDQQVVRGGLVLLIGMFDGIEVVGSARDGAEAVTLTEQLRPDVVLMDLDMPVLGGVAATALVREKAPGTAVLVLTTYADDDSVFPALRAGARGYLTKDADHEDVERAIRHVRGGGTWLDPVVQARLVTAFRSGDPAPTAAGTAGTAAGSAASDSAASGPDALPDGLTRREAEVLALIAQGLSNAQICARLVVSPATVKTHINHIFAKIGATDRAQAVGYAYRNRLTEPTA
ncbi:response regulator [Streptacidiphilus melanogenes]|uniref:response regulator n=1 Tax=Streptacidiphilus melanogenes TaxID=411235 RepID=UPI0005A9807F|nr:response regulator transcription factor [Streptacidiphilus melanogenes]